MKKGENRITKRGKGLKNASFRPAPRRNFIRQAARAHIYGSKLTANGDSIAETSSPCMCAVWPYLDLVSWNTLADGRHYRVVRDRPSGPLG